MKLKCVVIDDEPIACKLLKEYIDETDFIELLGIAENPLKAIGLINDLHPDLIFLDINMPKMSGLEFMRSIPNLPMVIMTTAYGQYALEGFELSVIDYMVKPFSFERFLKATKKALELKSLRESGPGNNVPAADHFFVKCDGKIERVIFNELILVEAMANYVVLHTGAGKRIVYLTIKGILEQLPPAQFIQVHKSYLVNINKVQSIEGNVLHLGGSKITMGTNYAPAVIDRLLKDKLIKRL